MIHFLKEVEHDNQLSVRMGWISEVSEERRWYEEDGMSRRQFEYMHRGDRNLDLTKERSFARLVHFIKR